MCALVVWGPDPYYHWCKGLVYTRRHLCDQRRNVGGTNQIASCAYEVLFINNYYIRITVNCIPPDVITFNEQKTIRHSSRIGQPSQTLCPSEGVCYAGLTSHPLLINALLTQQSTLFVGSGRRVLLC